MDVDTNFPHMVSDRAVVLIVIEAIRVPSGPTPGRFLYLNYEGNLVGNKTNINGLAWKSRPVTPGST